MKKVIYTTIVGGYDDLLEQPRYPGWDYVCFSDKPPLGWRSLIGASCWKVVTYDKPVDNQGLDNTLYSRLPKIMTHRYLAEYDYSVYIDGNARLIANPDVLLDDLGWPDFVASHHPFRDNIYEEFEECMAQGMDLRERFETQCASYRRAGLPDPTVLFENNFLLRRHNAAEIQTLQEAWWQELLDQSKRDQLSLPYICWHLKISPTLITQDLKRQYFRTKAHYRSMKYRLGRSIRKRLNKQ